MNISILCICTAVRGVTHYAQRCCLLYRARVACDDIFSRCGISCFGSSHPHPSPSLCFFNAKKRTFPDDPPAARPLFLFLQSGVRDTENVYCTCACVLGVFLFFSTLAADARAGKARSGVQLAFLPPDGRGDVLLRARVPGVRCHGRHQGISCPRLGPLTIVCVCVFWFGF